MKRLDFLLILLCFCVFLSSCRNTEESKVDEATVLPAPAASSFDSDRSENHLASRFTEDSAAAFFLTGGAVSTDPYAYIMFIDKNSGVSGYLCGKPECTHDNESCDAYVGIGPAAYGITIYNGQLYYVAEKYSKDHKVYHGQYLYAVQADGNKRKEIRELESPESARVLSDMSMLLHHDYLFLSGTATGVEDGIPYQQQYVSAYALDGKGKRDIYISDKITNAAEKVLIQAVQEELYILRYVYHRDEDKKQIELLRWNIKDSHMETLYQGESSFIPYEFWVNGEEVLFTCIEPAQGQVFCFDLGTRQFREKFSFSNDCGEERAIGIVDGKMISYHYSNAPDYTERRLEIRDFEGSLLVHRIDKEPLIDDLGLPYIRVLLGADHDFIYYQFADLAQYGNEEPAETLIKAVPLEGVDKVLWSNMGEGEK